MNIEEFIAKIEKKNPKVVDDLKRDLPFHIARMVVNARLTAGMTQAQLAKKVGTKQPAIARIENGNSLPSLVVLDKMAKRAFGSFLIPPRFSFMPEDTCFAASNTKESANNVSKMVISMANISSPYVRVDANPNIGAEDKKFTF